MSNFKMYQVAADNAYSEGYNVAYRIMTEETAVKIQQEADKNDSIITAEHLFGNYNVPHDLLNEKGEMLEPAMVRIHADGTMDALSTMGGQDDSKLCNVTKEYFENIKTIQRGTMVEVPNAKLPAWALK